MSLQSSRAEMNSHTGKYIKVGSTAQTMANCNILRLLSYALSASLNNYYTLLKIPDPKAQTETNAISLNNLSSQNKSVQCFNKKIGIIKQKEDLKHQPYNKNRERQSSIRLDAPKDKEELLLSTLPTNINLTIKSNEASFTRQAFKQNNKKTSKLVGKSNEDKIEIPEIDLIAESYLPKYGLSVDRIKGIREELLQRQVEQWQIKSKNQRLKRQVRLLLS